MACQDAANASSAVSSCSLRRAANRSRSSESLRADGVPLRNRSARYLGAAREDSLITVCSPSK